MKITIRKDGMSPKDFIDIHFEVSSNSKVLSLVVEDVIHTNGRDFIIKSRYFNIDTEDVVFYCELI